MNTIQDYWEDYSKKVMNPEAGETQRIETRLAFYAGAFSVLNIMISLPEDISEDAGAAIIDGLHEEIKLFSKRSVGEAKKREEGKG